MRVWYTVCSIIDFVLNFITIILTYQWQNKKLFNFWNVYILGFKVLDTNSHLQLSLVYRLFNTLFILSYKKLYILSCFFSLIIYWNFVYFFAKISMDSYQIVPMHLFGFLWFFIVVFLLQFMSYSINIVFMVCNINNK